MKKFRTGLIFIALLLILTLGYAQGYIITIDAPTTLIKGIPLTVTGNTTFPEDTYFDLVLSYSKYTSQEVTQTKVIVDPTQAFRVDFDTRNLEKGQYKVEVHNIVSDNELFVEQQLGSASTIRRIVQITDRSDEIQITSPEKQPLDQALTISGRMKDIGNGVLTLRVFGPDNFTYGPEQLITEKGYTDNSGEFSTTVPVSVPGEYQASMSDKNGYIGEYQFNVTGITPEETIPQMTEKTTEPTKTPEIMPTQVTPATVPPSPIPTQTPFPVISLIAGISGVILIIGRKL